MSLLKDKNISVVEAVAETLSCGSNTLFKGNTLNASKFDATEIKNVANSTNNSSSVLHEKDDKWNELYKVVFEQQQNVFLYGVGGVGKSYYLKKIYEVAKLHNMKCAITSTTGSSAVDIGGITIHSWAGIGIGKSTSLQILEDIQGNPAKSYLKKRWKKTDLLIIDEIGMLSRTAFQTICCLGMELRGNIDPFGGLQVIVAGDFLQLKPVNDGFAFESKSWNSANFQTVQLSQPHRFTDKTYFELLSRCRMGYLNENDIHRLEKRKEVGKVMFQSFFDSTQKEELRLRPTLVYSHRADVDLINTESLEKLPGKRFVYQASDHCLLYNRLVSQGKKLKASEKALLDKAVPEQLKLKVGAQIMVTKNLCIDSGIINGTIGLIQSCVAGGIWIKLKDQRVVKIEQHDHQIEPDDDKKLVRTQLPVKLAFASTIHNLQGKSLDFAIMDLSTVFDDSQVYVALSRVRNLESLYLIDINFDSIKSNQKAVEFDKSICEKLERSQLTSA